MSTVAAIADLRAAAVRRGSGRRGLPRVLAIANCRSAALLSLLLFLVIPPWLHAAKDRTAPRFYVVVLVPGGTDAIPPHKYSSILEVTQEGDDLRVRAFLVELDETVMCPQSDVRAVEVVLKGTTLRSLTGPLDLCSLSVEDFDRASGVDELQDPGLGNPWHGPGYGVVAACQDGDKLFRIPPVPDDASARAAIVNDLLQLQDKVVEVAFPGRGLDLHEIVAGRESQSLGEQLLEELRSGRYDLGYWGGSREAYLERALARYHGPRGRDNFARVSVPGDVVLRDGPIPAYPGWAAMTSVQGKVEVELRADPGTGKVLTEWVVSGDKLLIQAVLDAVRQWRFEPSLRLSNPVRVTLEFSLDKPCKADDSDRAPLQP